MNTLTPETKHPSRFRPPLAAACLRGKGLEIGALHGPLPLPPYAHAVYVDRLPMQELRKHYPDLQNSPFYVDIVDDGETLLTFADSSQSFVIANHFLEHCEDPITTLQAFARVLQSGGMLYMAVPDKRFTFDHARPVTSLQHIIDDHAFGAERSREAHYDEWTKYVCQITDEHVCKKKSMELMKMSYSIHFHVWTEREFLEFLDYACSIVPLEKLWTLQDGNEILCILQKQ